MCGSSSSFKGEEFGVDIVLLKVVAFAFESGIVVAGSSVLPPVVWLVRRLLEIIKTETYQ
jgi:hypothetical protein